MEVIDTFLNITGYDLSEFFSDFVTFNSNYFDNYVGYYKGSATLNYKGVLMINQLKEEADKIEDIFDINKESLSQNIDMWSLYDDFSSIKIKIETVLSSPKWMRSSYVSDYDKNINVSHILKQNQSLEILSKELGDNSPDDDWVRLAISNSLMENDYDSEGGNNLQVTFSNNKSINTTSVVAVMMGYEVLGRDINKEMEFVDDDLSVLEPKDTLNQAAEILINLTKGSVPEFPNDGVDSNIIGSNINKFKYPIVFRQLADVYRKDDTFKEIEVLGSETVEDNIEMSIRIVSKLNDVMNKGVYING